MEDHVAKTSAKFLINTPELPNCQAQLTNSTDHTKMSEEILLNP